MSSPFPCGPVIREWSWKKTQKKKKKNLRNGLSESMVYVIQDANFQLYRAYPIGFIWKNQQTKTNISVSIYSSIHPSIHPSIHASIYLSIYLFIYRSIHPSIHLSIYLCKRVRLFIDRTVCVSKIICSEEKKYLMR